MSAYNLSNDNNVGITAHLTAQGIKLARNIISIIRIRLVECAEDIFEVKRINFFVELIHLQCKNTNVSIVTMRDEWFYLEFAFLLNFGLI